jgi:hypothetical protein
MKPIHRAVTTGILGCVALIAGSSALAEDGDACRGGYPILLMTPAECQTYLKQLGEVRASADRLAELELLEWHTALLIQRAEACPCQQGKPVVLSQRAAANQKYPKKLND